METPIFFAQTNSFGEFAREPILTVACVLLIVVSIAWIVVSRMIVRQLKRYDKALAQPRRGRPTQRTRKAWDQGPGSRPMP
jgi:ABC-type Fe3+ transport system permease subunit